MLARQAPIYTRLILFVLILALGAGGVGCKKMRAKLKRDRFERLKGKSEQYNPYNNVPDQANRADERFQDGVQAFQQQRFDEALNILTEAVNLEKQVLESARQAEAQVMFSKAQQELQIANNNSARQEDPELFAQIEENFSQAEEARIDQDWDDVIDYSREVVDLVNQILTPLRNTANSRIKEAASQRETLTEEGAQEYAPDYVSQVDRLIEEARNEFSEDVRAYRDAIARADDAIAKAKEGITETRKQISAEKIGTIESLLTEARTLESETWVPDTFQKVENEYTDLIEAHESQQDYLAARDISDSLIPMIQNMIVTTRRLRAQAALNEFETQLTQLITEEAKRYLEEQVSEVEQTRDQAVQLFEEEDYSRVEQISNKGITMIESVREAYNSFTRNEIGKAQSQYDIAKQVFDRMQQVFIVKPAEYIKRIDLEFENNKQALRNELDATLKDVSQKLERAENLRVEENKYHEAIVLAREQADRSNQVLAETYNVVAHNAINEVADQLSRWKGDGGAEWAQQQILETEQALNAAIELRNLRKFKEAISQAAEARWKLDFAIQLIKEKAVSELEAARQQIESAKDQQAQQYQSDPLSQAQSLYLEAQNFLQDEQLKKSILTAMESQRIAQDATAQARLMWTRDQINRAVEEVRKAEEAGSAFYAEKRLDKAQDLLATARRLFDTEEYTTARLSANQAIEEALAARFYKVNQADDVIDTVRRYGGWKYDNRRLSNAIVMAKNSRELMEQGQYQQANELADEARATAESVLNFSKIRAFEEQMQNIEATLNDVLNSGAKFYLTSNIREMLKEIEEIERNFTIENFDSVIVQANRINKNMNQMLEQTPQLVQEAIAEKRQRIDEIEARDDSFLLKKQTSEIKRLLGLAEADYRKERYSSSYQNLRRANEELARLESKFVRDAYLDSVHELLEEYTAANDEFSQILRLDARTLLSFTQDPQGKQQYSAIAGGLSPFQYRSQIDSLYNRALDLQHPDDMDSFHRELIAILKKTRQAAINFEQLQILDQYDEETVKELISQAYEIMDQVRERQQELAEQLRSQQTGLQPIAAQG